MSKTIIIGHKNPDTDSIVSALGAKEYFSAVLGEETEVRRAGELNNETKFILGNLGIALPELAGEDDRDARLVLVDHNESGQVSDALNYENVAFVFDHHKLSIKTEAPIICRTEPIGSTSSLIAKMMMEKDAMVSEVTSKLLLAGILSDTLNFTSPTATPEDKTIAQKLNEVAKLDLDAFASQMFKAKSSLEGISTEDIVTLDYKTFEMGTKNVGVGTWETTDPESVNVKKQELFEALLEKKSQQSLDYIFFMVVDILKQNCQLYVIGDEERMLAEKVFGKSAHDGIIELPGVVSRKKQIIPQLTEELSK